MSALTGGPTDPTLRSRPTETGDSGRLELITWLIILTLMAGLLALAWIPDRAVLRPKATWTQAWLAASACLLLLRCALRGHWQTPGLPLLIAGGALALVAAAHAGLLAAQGTLISAHLAQDEVLRLALVPIVTWVVACAALDRRARSLLLTTLVAASIPVSALALGQSLAGVLPLPIDRMQRAAASFGNPVFLGAYLVGVIPLTIASAMFGKSSLRWLGALAAGLALPALIATQSRLAWLGAAVGLVLGLALLAPTAHWRRRLLLAALLIGAGLMALATPILMRPQAHALIWRDTLAMLARNPWGVGAGQYQVAFLPYASAELLEVYPRERFVINDAHSEPLQLAAELGPAGLLAALIFVALLAGLAVSRVRAARDSGDLPLVVALTAGLAGACVQSLGSPDLRFGVSTLHLSVLMGLLAGWTSMTASRSVLGGRSGRVLLGVVAVVGLLAVGLVTRERLSVARLLSPEAQMQSKRSGSSSIAPEAALPLLEQRVRDAPGDSEAHYRLGLALMQAGQHQRAAQSFEEASRGLPDSPALRRTLGIAQALAGQVESATTNLKLALAGDPEDADVRYLLAYLAWTAGDLAAALRDVEALLARHPEHRAGRLLLARLRE